MMKANSAEQIIIYSLVSFDRGAKVRWLLTELDLKHETRFLNREKKENESPEFLKLNPMGRVPVLKIDDIVMFESNAICAYLADRYLDRGLAPVLAAPERAIYQQWMYFADNMLDVIQTRIMAIEDIPPGDLLKGKEAKLLSDLRDALETLDITLAKSDYLVAGKFSAADICVSYHLYWLTLWPELNVVIREFPRVVAYSQRMQNRPAAVKADVFSYSE